MGAHDVVRRLDDLVGPSLLRVDELCDRFESALRRGERPCLASYARELPEADRLVAAGELLRVEVEYRVRRGEVPIAREYEETDPALDPTWVEQVIAAELVVHRSDLSAASPASGRPEGSENGELDHGGPGSPAALAAGSGCVGHYRLLEPLGSGANGSVWKAIDEELDRVVTLKIPHTHRATADFLARFSREARVVARLRHPGIVTLHEVLQWEGRPVLVSDFVEGSPLDDLLARRRLLPREAAEVAAKLAETLAYVHEMGAVHRDIKPANVLIPRKPAEAAAPDDLNNPRILDFGLAIVVGSQAALTQDGDFFGTPAYMSPEQASGRVREIDGRSDIYSLGVVLYEMLCGGPPFRGPHPVLVLRILHESPPRPRSIDPAIPRDLEVICLKAIAKDRRERYGSAREMAEDLRRVLARRADPGLSRWSGPPAALLGEAPAGRGLAFVDGLGRAPGGGGSRHGLVL